MRNPDDYNLLTPYEHALAVRRWLAGLPFHHASDLLRRYPDLLTPATPGAPAAPERAGPEPPPRAVAGEPPRPEISKVHADRGRRSGEVRRARASDRDARIVAAREAGMSQREIARREGVSRGAVVKALARHRAEGACEP